MAGVYTSSFASSLFTVFDHQSLSCPKSLYYSENDLISSLNTVFMFPYVSYITSAIYVLGTSFALSLTVNSNYFLSTRPFVIVKIVSLPLLLFFCSSFSCSTSLKQFSFLDSGKLQSIFIVLRIMII